jgi:hypothetical protein
MFTHRSVSLSTALLLAASWAHPAQASESVLDLVLFGSDYRDNLRHAADETTSYAIGDFNSDGYDDLAIGMPGATVNGQARAGKVMVVLSDEHGLTQMYSTYSQGQPNGTAERMRGANEAGDYVGFALAAGDFNGDGHDDLAVSAPGETYYGNTNTGCVFVAHGGNAALPFGLDFGEVSKPLCLDQRQGDRYDIGVNDKNAEGLDLEEDWATVGMSLLAGDWNADGIDDLAIGAPGMRVDGRWRSGAVFVVGGTEDGLDTRTYSPSFFHQETVSGRGTPHTEFPLTSNTGDLTGFSLASGDFDGNGFEDLAIGAPGDTLKGRAGSGSVMVLMVESDGQGNAGPLDTSYIGWKDGFNQASAHGDHKLQGGNETGDAAGFSLAAGDFNNDGFDDLIVGAPGEDIGSTRANAGALFPIAGSMFGLDADVYSSAFYLAQSRADYDLCGSVGGAGDRLGQALVAGDFNADGTDDLAIGAPGFTVNGQADAGEVLVINGTADLPWNADTGLAGSPCEVMSQTTGNGMTDLYSNVEAGDNVGASLAYGYLSYLGHDGTPAALVISAPGESWGATPTLGFSHVIAGGYGLDAGDEIIVIERNGILETWDKR